MPDRFEKLADKIADIKDDNARVEISRTLGYYDELKKKEDLISHLKVAPDWVVNALEDHLEAE